MGRGERVAEQLRRVEGAAGRVGGASAVYDGGGVGHLAVSLRVVSQVVVRVGVAGQRPVGGAPGLEGTGPAGGAGAPVSPHLGTGTGRTSTTASTADRAASNTAITIPDNQMIR